MRYLRQTTIALLCALAFFFNIERLDFAQENVVNLSTFVYPLTFCIILLVLTVPRFMKASAGVPVFLWGISYLAWQVFFPPSHNVPPGAQTYLYITELTHPSVVIWVTHNFAKALWDFESAVEEITFEGQSKRPQSLEEAAEATSKAIKVSRRYERPLSVIVLECDSESSAKLLNRAIQDVQKSILNRRAAISMSRVLDSVLRCSDMLLEQPGRARFVIVCPETDRENSELLAQRIREAASESLGISVQYGAAALPDDALTMEELVHQAENNMAKGSKILTYKPPPTGNTVAQNELREGQR